MDRNEYNGLEDLLQYRLELSIKYNQDKLLIVVNDKIRELHRLKASIPH